MARRNNCQPAKGVTTGKMTKAAWATFNALPRELKLALWSSPVPINPVSVAETLAFATTSHVLRRVRSSVADEIAMFDQQHRKRFGRSLPHVRAYATVQPYSRFERVY